MSTVYLETTVVSYLTARPSRDLVVAGHQQSTREWWDGPRQRFTVYVLSLVVAEAQGGDAEAARRRLEAMEGLPSLEVNDAAVALGQALIDGKAIAQRAAADALHISVAAVHGIEYLLTWNMAHIANAELRPQIERICRAEGVEPPVLCTPEELMGR